MPLDPQKTYSFAPRPMAGLWTDDTGPVHASTSGWERNRLFVNRGSGRAFVDLSSLSGADDDADGRAFAWLDLDRDGWLDLAVANANRPFLRLFHNRLGRAAGGGDPAGDLLAIRLVGAQRAAVADLGRSNRDGVGARLEVAFAEGPPTVYERRAGEGFAAQNSATFLVPLGTGLSARSVTVLWPSGRRTEVPDPRAGSLLVIHEPAADGEAPRVDARPYRPTAAVALGRGLRSEARRLSWIPDALGEVASSADLALVTTMATWCPSCRGELPVLAELRAEFGIGELAILAVPIDPNDTDVMLDAYLAELRPGYRLVRQARSERGRDLHEVAMARIHQDVLPTSYLVRRDGEVLEVVAGVPHRSQVRRRLSGR